MNDRPKGSEPEVIAALDLTVVLVVGCVLVLVLAMAVGPSLVSDIARSRRAAEIRKAIKRLSRPT